MNRVSYVVLISILFFLINLPESFVNQLRYINISCASLGARVNKVINNEKKNELDFQKILMENNRLQTQLEAVKEWIQFDQRIDDLFQKYNQLEKNKDNLREKEFFRRREEELCKLINHYLHALPANVVFRDPSLWASSCWIGVGSKDNELLEKVIVATNSPVVVGNALVGVIDYVGKNKSRVRLITDSELNPSVRAIRGNSQNQELLRVLKNFEMLAYFRDDLFDTKTEKNIFFDVLNKLSEKVKKDGGDYYLAKGQLKGFSAPLWRASDSLRGIGFNYDYPDEEGPARDLRTGDPLSEINKHSQMPILKEGDLLVTTGMDGVFPAGLNVAIVTSIDDLDEGGYAYSLEAKPCADNLQNLQSVFVLPPLDEEVDVLSSLKE